MGLDTDKATLLVKLIDTDMFVSRRKRERLITPPHTPAPAADTPAGDVPPALA
jgi:hypothetical protein